MTQVQLTPLGGLGEIGINMMLLEVGDRPYIIDCGVMFPHEELPGIDLILPDWSYLHERGFKELTLLITHGHEDHIGAIPFLLREFKAEIYATTFTIALLEQKLEEHGVSEQASLHEIKPRDVLTLGDLTVEFIKTCHSIPDCVGMALTTPEGIILHSGDFKMDNSPIDRQPTDLQRFSEYGEKGVLLMMSDSTNSENSGYSMSEGEVAQNLHTIFSDAPGRVVIASFASNIHRIQQILDVSADLGRKVLVAGRRMQQNMATAREIKYLTADESLFCERGDLEYLPDNHVTILCTGTQGEPRAALSRMVWNDNVKLKIEKGDTVVFSSRLIPGNERSIHDLVNQLYRRGAEVFYGKQHPIHVSGHAYNEEQMLMLNMVRPKYFVPVHGEYRQMALHGKLSVRTGVKPNHVLVIEDGQSLEFREGKVWKTEKVTSGRVYVDGKGVGDVEDIVVKDRRSLAYSGLVVAVVLLDKDSHQVISGPDVYSRGFTGQDDFEAHETALINEIKTTLQSCRQKGMNDLEALREEVRLVVRRYFRKKLERKPTVIPIVLKL